MTSRQKILARFETLLGSITGTYKFSYIEVNKMTPVDIKKHSFPMGFIYSGGEQLDTDEYGSEHKNWEITLEMWDKETDMEDLLPAVNTVIWADYLTANEDPVSGSLEDLVSSMRRVDTDTYVIDPTKNINGLSITYRIVHSPDLGTV